MSEQIEQPIRLFYSYAHEDESFRKKLEKHLTVLMRTRVIAPWHDRRITAGRDWEQEIDKHLEAAQVVLLLVSADFLASDYCWGVEMKRALERHDAGLARAIPVMIRPVDFFAGVPFARLQALPRDAKPITEWLNEDAAWVDVARGIRLACTEVQQLRSAHAAGILAPISVLEESARTDLSPSGPRDLISKRIFPSDGDKVTVEILDLHPDRTLVAGEEPRLYDIMLGEGQAIPDLEAAILNLEEGEARDFQIRFPSDFVEAGQRGVTRLLRIKLVKIDQCRDAAS